MESFIDDRELIEAVLTGNTAAYDSIVKKYQRVVYQVVLRMLKQTEDADEITQKTFVKAYRGLAGFRFESSFKTWLLTIAVNLCRTELVKVKRLHEELPAALADPQYENSREQEAENARKASLKEALEHLPHRQKEVVTLRIYQEMAFKDIAAVLKSNETAVKVNFHHAMKSLREWMEKK